MDLHAFVRGFGPCVVVPPRGRLLDHGELELRLLLGVARGHRELLGGLLLHRGLLRRGLLRRRLLGLLGRGWRLVRDEVVVLRGVKGAFGRQRRDARPGDRREINKQRTRRLDLGSGRASGFTHIVDDRLALRRSLRSRGIVRQVDHVDVRLGLLHLWFLGQHRRGGLILLLLILGLGRRVPRGFLRRAPEKGTDIRRHVSESTVPNAKLPPALPTRPPRSCLSCAPRRRSEVFVFESPRSVALVSINH